MEQVFAGFTEELFKALKPPGMSLELLRFDGCDKGDEVHLKVGVWPLKEMWISKIIDQKKTKDAIYFVDEGSTLPMFFKTWKHTHWVKVNEKGGAIIVDEIDYTCKVPGMEYLLYPMMRWMFGIRTPIYQRFFKKLTS